LVLGDILGPALTIKGNMNKEIRKKAPSASKQTQLKNRIKT